MTVVATPGPLEGSADPVATAASELVGGPRGRYAAISPAPQGRHERPLAAVGWMAVAAWVALLAAVPTIFGVIFRAPCLRSAWDPKTSDQYWSMCYSDFPATWRGGGVTDNLGAWAGNAGARPQPAEPPLLNLLMNVMGSLVPASEDVRAALRTDTHVRWYFGLWAVVIAVLVVLTAVLVAGMLPSHRRWAATHVALSPVVALAAYVAPDMVGVALATAGLFAWTRERHVAAGVLLGLGITARFYPVLILIALALVAWRSNRLREASSTAGAALVTTGGVWLLTLAVNPTAAEAAISRWWAVPAGYGSPWFLPALTGHGMPAPVATVLTIAGWVAAIAAGAYLVVSSRVCPSVAEVSLVIVGIVLVTGKTFTVQSSLWLVPLVALSLMPWRDPHLWAAAEAAHFIAVWLRIAGTATPNRGLPGPWYAVFLSSRMAAVIWLVAMVWLTARQRGEWDEEPSEGGLEADPGVAPGGEADLAPARA